MPKPQSTATVDAPKGETINPFDLDSLLGGYENAAEPTPKKPAPKVAAEGDDEPAEKPKKATHEHSGKAIRMGLSVGLTEEDMAGMSLDDLADEIMDRKSMQVHRAEGAAAAAIATANTAPKTTLDRDLPEKPAHDFGGASLADVDDEIVKALRHMAARIAALEAGTNEVKKTIQDRESRTVADQLDALFMANPTHFGDRPGAKVKEDSAEGRKRLAVIDSLRRLKTKTTLERDFAEAVEALGWSPVAADEEEPEESPAQKWAKAGLAKPTGRKDPPKPKGVSRATDVVKKGMEQLGISVGGDNGFVSLDDFAD